VLAGEYELRVGEQTLRAMPGTFVFGSRGIPHTFKCLGPNPGKIQVIISPPGFEAFVEELDVLAKQGSPTWARPWPWPESTASKSSAPAGGSPDK
jgi:hypothetical protein